jgi:hypothetical protein
MPAHLILLDLIILIILGEEYNPYYRPTSYKLHLNIYFPFQGKHRVSIAYGS